MSFSGYSIVIRDQKPLHAKTMLLAPGFDVPDLVYLLNQHVFFWPGTEDGPCKSGRNHWARYASERPVLLRVKTSAYVQAGEICPLRFSSVNSGAPRCSDGRPSPRGPDLFRPVDTFPDTVSKVVEVVIMGPVLLPREVQMSQSLKGPWGRF